jgi:N-acetylglutamate synthase-like GNAT family acetyltransferase
MELIKINHKNKMWKDFLIIYDDVFEHYEKESIENIKEKSNNVLVTVEDNKVVGFCILVDSLDNNFTLIWYLGVSKEKQGLGIGSIFLNLIIDDFNNNSKQPRLIVEAESQQANWYSKKGFLNFDYNYKYPNFSDSLMSPTSLMTIEKNNLKEIKRDIFKTLLKDLYLGVYKKSPSDNKILKEIDGVIKDIKCH